LFTAVLKNAFFAALTDFDNDNSVGAIVLTGSEKVGCFFNHETVPEGWL
jgi:hypothetical protein